MDVNVCRHAQRLTLLESVSGLLLEALRGLRKPVLHDFGLAETLLGKRR
jgi:hypothetical protein